MSGSTPEIPSAVCHVKENKLKGQWARGIFYRQDGPKLTAISRSFIVAAVGLFVSGSIVSIVFGGEPAEQRATSTIAVATLGRTSRDVSIPEASATAPVAKETEQHVKKVVKTQAPLKLGKLQVFGRSNASEIPLGTMFKARLTSGAANGPLRAEVIEPVVIDGDTRLEPGTVLLGEGQATEERLFIRFSHLAFKDGSTQEIQAQACDNSDSTVGLKGSKVGSYALKLAAAAALNFAGGVSEGLQESEVQNGVATKAPSTKNALLNGSAHAALDQAKDTMNEAKSEPPLIEVPRGTWFWVLVQGGK